MASLVDPTGLRIADIACGGGIYSRAWLTMGAAEVIGIDRSQSMISAATETCTGLSGASFQVGDAANTGLPDSTVDVVFERALIHHIEDVHSCFQEAMRVLKPGGLVLIQDRTPEDVSLPGSEEHIRGYFLECFPRLLHVELGRRRAGKAMLNELRAALFEDSATVSLWETRKVYASKFELWEDIRQRKGRSILHELDDGEIRELISFIDSRVLATGQIVEKDRWTIWKAMKP